MLYIRSSYLHLTAPIQTYDGAEYIVFMLGPHTLKWPQHSHTIPIIMIWILHNQPAITMLQHLLVTWSPFVAFAVSFQQSMGKLAGSDKWWPRNITLMMVWDLLNNSNCNGKCILSDIVMWRALWLHTLEKWWKFWSPSGHNHLTI